MMPRGAAGEPGEGYVFVFYFYLFAGVPDGQVVGLVRDTSRYRGDDVRLFSRFPSFQTSAALRPGRVSFSANAKARGIISAGECVCVYVSARLGEDLAYRPFRDSRCGVGR